MKKIFLTLLAVLSVFGLASCGGDKSKTKKTTITFCSWDFGTESKPTLRRELINKWNADETKDTYIKMVEHQGDYNEFINTLASASNLPDIFMVNSVSNAVISKQAMDITNFANADAEWATIDEALRNSVTYSESIYAIPAAQFYNGFFANYNLLNDEAGLKGQAEELFAPGAYSYEEFFAAIKAVQKVDVTDGSGFIGVNATGDMINWLPSSIDSKLEKPEGISHYIWNGTSLDMNGSTMINALETIEEIGAKDAKYTLESLAPAAGEEDQRDLIFGGSDKYVVFEAGKMAFIQGATSDSFDEEKMGFNYKFIAYPDAKVISVADYFCLSKAIKDPKKATQAYEIAKYLTFGADGINARYEIVAANADIELAGLPMVNNPELTAKWFDYVTLKGVKEVYDKVQNNEIQVIVEPNKAVPGYANARFNQLTGVIIEGLRGDSEYKINDFIWDVCGGDISVAQYTQYMTDELEAKINDNIVQANAKVAEIVAADLTNRLSPVVPAPEGETAQ